MKFGPLTTRDAEGALLAHSVKLPEASLKKGHRLTTEDVSMLLAAGVDSVIAARLELDDVHEDDAAAELAGAIAGDEARLSRAVTGRVNIFAKGAGLLILDRAQIDAINLVDEALTVATLSPHERVAEGQMLATVKIIPFAVSRSALDEAAALSRGDTAALSLAPFQPRSHALIQTRLEGTKDKMLDKTVEITRARVEDLGGRLVSESRCAHSVDEVADAITAALTREPDILLIAGASAIVDRRDVLPIGIEQAGGEVLHYGMPVDPGNLILLGRIGERPVLGLPGCARSPKLNGFDWVLERFAAGVPVTPRDIMLMGVGGLLAEIPTRPLPRARATEQNGGGRHGALKVAALVLAAGQSRRMGTKNKLLMPLSGRPMLDHVLDAVAASRVDAVYAVVGHQQDAVRERLAARKTVTVVENPDFVQGLGSSLKAGLSSLPDDIDGVLVCLGDMPRVTAAHIDRLLEAFNPVEGRTICVPTYRNRQGNPVLLGRELFDALIKQLEGDSGARALIRENPELVHEVQVEDAGVLLDIDTPSALAALEGENPVSG